MHVIRGSIFAREGVFGCDVAGHINPTLFACRCMRSEGSIPPDLGGLTSMQILSLHDNNLSGESGTNEQGTIQGTSRKEYRMLLIDILFMLSYCRNIVHCGVGVLRCDTSIDTPAFRREHRPRLLPSAKSFWKNHLSIRIQPLGRWRVFPSWKARPLLQ